MNLNDLYKIANFINENYIEYDVSFNIHVFMSKDELEKLDKELYETSKSSLEFNHTPTVKASINNVDFVLTEK